MFPHLIATLSARPGPARWANGERMIVCHEPLMKDRAVAIIAWCRWLRLSKPSPLENVRLVSSIAYPRWR